MVMKKLIDVVVEKIKLKSISIEINKKRINRGIDSAIDNLQEDLERLAEKSLNCIMEFGQKAEENKLQEGLESYLAIENQKEATSKAIKNLENLKKLLISEVEVEEEK